MAHKCIPQAADLIIRVHAGDPPDIADLLSDLDWETARRVLVLLAAAADPEASLWNLRTINLEEIEIAWLKRAHAVFTRMRKRESNNIPNTIIEGEIGYQRWRHRENESRRRSVASKTSALKEETTP